MSGKHTPGPWFYRSQPHDDWGIVRAGRFIICQARDPNVFEELDLDAHRRAKTDPWEANARLIASAPDLLEALVATVAVLTDPVVGTTSYDDPDWYQALDAAVTKARKALSDATGGGE